MQEDVLLRWTSRKFWAAMFWQAIITILLYLGKMPIDAYQNLSWLFVGGYFVGNVAQKYLIGVPPEEPK